MNKVDYVIACPYCKRQYRMKLDLEEITAKKTRATCGRCGNSFELAPRIHTSEAQVVPPPPPLPASSSAVDIDVSDVLSSMSVESLDADATVTRVTPSAQSEDVKATQFIPALHPPVHPAAQPVVPPDPPAAPTEPLAASQPVDAPRTWQDLADPGLTKLREEPTLALLALEQLL